MFQQAEFPVSSFNGGSISISLNAQNLKRIKGLQRFDFTDFHGSQVPHIPEAADHHNFEEKARPDPALFVDFLPPFHRRLALAALTILPSCLDF